MNELLLVNNLTMHFPVGPPAMPLAGFFRPASAPKNQRPLLRALDGVSFAVGENESVGLVGESGCGKSTLVRLISRLADATSGNVHFEGWNIGSVPARLFNRSPHRRAIQVVFQDPTESLNPRHSAFNAIAEPLRRLLKTRGETLNDRVRKLAEMVGLAPELLGRFPHQLSGGQKARVNIARAIAVEPKLLILDEPTSALDVSVQAVILKLLADLKDRLGLSYLFVSHDLNVVRLLCERVIVMYLGKIVESGSVEEIFQNPRHPYTKALLSAVPNMDDRAGNTAIKLTGEPQSPIDPDPNRCRFYGRCPIGADRCTEEMPDLVPVVPEHHVACHFSSPAE